MRVPPLDGFVPAAADEAVEILTKNEVVDGKPVRLNAVEGLRAVAVYLPDFDERIPATADELPAVGQPAEAEDRWLVGVAQLLPQAERVGIEQINAAIAGADGQLIAAGMPADSAQAGVAQREAFAGQASVGIPSKQAAVAADAEEAGRGGAKSKNGLAAVCQHAAGVAGCFRRDEMDVSVKIAGDDGRRQRGAVERKYLCVGSSHQPASIGLVEKIPADDPAVAGSRVELPGSRAWRQRINSSIVAGEGMTFAELARRKIVDRMHDALDFC